MQGGLWNYEQAADYLGISVKTLRRWTAERKIETIRMSHTVVRFRKQDLDSYISKCCRPAVGE